MGYKNFDPATVKEPASAPPEGRVGSIEMYGGAIANNTMSVTKDGVNGAGIAAAGGSIVLDQGAEITNNSLASWISRGGGIYASNCSLTLNACFIGFNTAGNYAANAYAAGGGVAAIGGSKITVNQGCYITGNTSANIGGGMWCGDPGGAVLYVRGGTFCWNTALSNEGGGLALAYKSASVGIIESGTFYQNQTLTPEQWGGGGIFCAEGSYLYFPNGASLYDNHADGYGGGLASCSTGKIVIDSKLAIFDNTTGRADGSHATSGSSSDKSADKIYVQTDKVFVERGANDVFGTSNTEISGLLPDGSGASWWGSMDGSPISNVNSGQLIADYLLGVTCEASTAVKEANAHMPVLIYENSSTVHGGGVLINGILLTSNPSTLCFGDSITLTASKQLLDTDGNKKDLSAYAGKFTFNVTDEKGTVVSVGTMTETGEIQFDRRLIFMPASPEDPAKTLTFYIEENSTGIADILPDQTKYKIVLSIEKHTDSIVDQDALVNGAHISITEYRFKISGAAVYKISPDGSETQVDCVFSQNAESLDYAPTLTLTKNETSFTNVQSSAIHITAQKNWEDGEENHRQDSIDIVLIQTNTSTGAVKEYNASLTSTTDPAWYYDFGSFPTKDSSGDYTYTLKEISAPPGYISVVTSSISAAAGSSSDVWIPVMNDESLQNGAEYLIVAENANTALANNYQNNYDEQNVTSSSKISLILNESSTVNGVSYSKVYQDSPGLAYALWTCNTSFSFTGYTSNAFYNQASGAYLRVENGKPNGLMFTNASNLSSYGGNFWKDGWNLYGKSKNGENSLILYSEGSTSFSSSLYYCTNKNQGSQYPVRLYRKASTAGAAGGVSENFVITNRIAENAEYRISLKKVDGEDQDMVLQNAVFTLSKQENGKNPLKFTAENTGYVYAEDTAETSTTVHLVSDRYGAIVLQGLPEGTYYLTEIQAPVGYTPLKAPIKMTINPDTVDWNTLTYTLEVQDMKKIISLPNTGLTSLSKWTLMQAGGLLLAISTAGLVWDDRRRKRIRKE